MTALMQVDIQGAAGAGGGVPYTAWRRWAYVPMQGDAGKERGHKWKETDTH